jgi:hypothetical protein
VEVHQLQASTRIPQLGLTETGLCLCALIDPRCFEGMLELDRDGVVERKIIFASQSDAFAAPRLRLASGTFGFNCGIRVQTNRWTQSPGISQGIPFSD